MHLPYHIAYFSRPGVTASATDQALCAGQPPNETCFNLCQDGCSDLASKATQPGRPEAPCRTGAAAGTRILSKMRQVPDECWCQSCRLAERCLGREAELVPSSVTKARMVPRAPQAG